MASHDPRSPRDGPVIVLVVEDEPLQRLDLVDIVTEAGFEVLEAFDAAHAIAILEARPDVRILFTDIDMPGGMDGLKLAAAVRRRWPPIEIVVVTAGRRPASDELPTGAVFMAKPIIASDATRELRKLAA